MASDRTREVTGCGPCPFGVSSVCGAKGAESGGIIPGYRFDMEGAPEWCPIADGPLLVELAQEEGG